jgi:hypothetical protein
VKKGGREEDRLGETEDVTGNGSWGAWGERISPKTWLVNLGGEDLPPKPGWVPGISGQLWTSQRPKTIALWRKFSTLT